MLYQYRGQISDEKKFGFLVNLLANGSLKFSKPSEFNDPFDCLPTVVWEAPVGALPHFVADQMHRGTQNALSQYIGISCFTPHPDKMLMWSHYGDQHRGICIGFDSDELKKNVIKNSEGHALFSDFRKVEYTNCRPKHGDENSIYKKSLEWQYEDEYRLVTTCRPGTPEWGPGVWNVPVSSIKEVILGARMAPEWEARVTEYVSSKNPDVTLKKAAIHSHHFEMIIDNLSDFPHCGESKGVILMPSGEWRNT